MAETYHRVFGHSGKRVPSNVYAGGVIQHDTRSYVFLIEIFGFDLAFGFAVTHVTVGEAVSGDGDPVTVRTDSQTVLVNDYKGIGGKGTAVSAEQVYAPENSWAMTLELIIMP